MKRAVPFIFVFLFLAITAAIFVKPVIIFCAQNQIKKVLKGSTVSIKSCGLDIFQRISFFDIKIQKSGSYDFKAKEISVRYNPLSVLRQTMSISLNGGEFQDLNGTIEGDLNLKIGRYPEYFARLNVVNLDLAGLIKHFKLEKKMQMTGRLGGKLNLKGRGAHINILSGDFLTAENGGVVIIKDAQFLKNIAGNSKQPLDIVVESLKDYHYNTSVIKLSLEKRDLILDMALQGEAGKRDINITLHEFTTGKGGL